MRIFKIVVLTKRSLILLITIFIFFLFISISLFIKISLLPANTFADPRSGIIVIDPGHGGIDGGTNKDGILEKEINLDVGRKLRLFLEQKGIKSL